MDLKPCTAWPQAMANVLAACGASGARLVFIDNLYQLGPQSEPRREDMALSDSGDKPAILAAVTEKTKLVFLANPNNPTGTYLPFDEVRRLTGAGIDLERALAAELAEGGAGPDAVGLSTLVDEAGAGTDSYQPHWYESEVGARVRQYDENHPRKAHSDTDGDQPQQNVPSSTSKRLLWLAMAFLVTLAGVSWLFWPDTMPDSAEQAIPLLRYTPITSLDGLEFYHNVSEDERYLVYSYASPENENVTVLMLEDLQEHRRIQITEDSYSSFGAAFSPDGRYIAYHRADTNGDCTIRLSLFDKKSLLL